MTNTRKSYFGSKKRDNSDKSNDGDERKKAKEGRLDLSLNQDVADVFSEGIDSARCASILYYCLNNLEKKSTKYTCSQPLRMMPRLKALSKLRK